MPQNICMWVGRRGLLLFVNLVCVFLSSCHQSANSFNYSYAANKADPISDAIDMGDWKVVLKLTEGKRDPLLELIRRRALYELKKFEDVLKTPAITDQRFASYDIFLKTLSAFNAEKYDVVISFDTPDDLPNPLLERLSMLHGEAHQELKQLEKARDLYEEFLKKYKRSSFRADVLVRLADIRLTLGEQEKAIQSYEDLYRGYPVSDNEDIARQKLIDSGRFAAIDTDAHLARIETLRRAALFKKAGREIELLLQKIEKRESRQRLELAMGQVRFGERNYRDAIKHARRALLQQLPEEIETQWRQILATSYIRTGAPEKGTKEFLLLLSKKINHGLKENIIYRLAMTALDNKEYSLAADYFKELRKDFSKGNYVESSHWFGALNDYLLGRSTEGAAGRNYLLNSITLLEKLPSLPDGNQFGAQSLYWLYLTHWLLDEKAKGKEIRRELEDNYPLAFHTRLLFKAPFKFLDDGKFYGGSSASQDLHIDSIEKISNDTAWQRLELFRSVNLKTWGSMELDRFLESYRGSDQRTLIAIADKLQGVEDWANLVRFAEKNFARPIKNLDLKDPIVKFHYPRAYEKEVLKYSSQFGVSPFLVWGVMREESRFRADVISVAGAVGLMQLMPRLGNRIGMTLRDSPSKRGQLTNPKRNIFYGTYHLLELQAQVDRLQVPEDLKPVLQVASYNAGIEAVQKWLKDKDFSSVDVFVESIPYQETRGYVKRVLQSAYVYYRLYGSGAKSEVFSDVQNSVSFNSNNGGTYETLR